MKHTVAALVEDRPGVLNRVASLFRRRGFNIDSLAVGTTEEAGISRMTIVVDGAEGIATQVERQLDKLIVVIAVEDLVRWKHPERGLLMPDAFLPVTEDTELICRLTDEVLVGVRAIHFGRVEERHALLDR